jgi:hypothetical protein
MSSLLKGTVGVLAAFIALTAIPGGAAILAEWERFPQVWLEGTPFPDYTIPAWLLSGGVGGTALIAAVLGLRRHRWAGVAGMVAGIVMTGFIVGELVFLNDDALWPHWLEWLYLGLGLLLAGVGWLARLAHPEALRTGPAAPDT